MHEKVTKEFSIWDALIVSASKVAEERITSPFIGNGTLMSGAIKLVTGVVGVGMIKPKFGKLISTGFVVDGVEDVLTAFLGGNAIKSLSPNQSANKIQVI